MKQVMVSVDGPAYMRQAQAIEIAKDALREQGYEVGNFEMDMELNRCLFTGYLEVDPEALILLEAGLTKDNVTIRKENG